MNALEPTPYNKGEAVGSFNGSPWVREYVGISWIRWLRTILEIMAYAPWLMSVQCSVYCVAALFFEYVTSKYMETLCGYDFEPAAFVCT